MKRRRAKRVPMEIMVHPRFLTAAKKLFFKPEMLAQAWLDEFCREVPEAITIVSNNPDTERFYDLPRLEALQASRAGKETSE